MLLLSAQTPETECLYNDHRTTFNNSKFKIQNSKFKIKDSWSWGFKPQLQLIPDNSGHVEKLTIDLTP
jgi:hypothetical protein